MIHIDEDNLKHGVLGLVLLGGIGVLLEDPTALRVLSFVGGMGLILFTVLGLPGLAAGIGLLRRRSWGRILALVLGIEKRKEKPGQER